MISLLVLVAPAFAATPVPDRPVESQSGYLIHANTLELEMGARWSNGFTSPTRVKYAIGDAVEARFHLDMAGVDSGEPDMRLESKIRIVRQKDVGLAALLSSTLPAHEGDTWEGRAMFLASGIMDPVLLTGNVGLAFQGAGGQSITFHGVPLSLMVAAPARGTLTGFAEAATRIDGGFHSWIFDAGLRLRLTEIVTVDSALGWSQEAAAPLFNVGLSANLGSVGG